MSVHAHSLRREQRLPGSPDDVFAFFGDARNLEAITPPLLRFRVMDSGPDGIEMGAGTLIRYRLRVHRVPVGWLTAIREWDPPHRFVDEQLRGPYALWHHTHTFEPIEDGAATLMRDVVRYALPFGLVGEAARRLFVARDVEAIFDYRAEAIRELL
jgi:ligand-binding SRPBCC domain-containing protein